MYMLIPMDFDNAYNTWKVLVYVDSTGFLNACKLCICWLQWILIILVNYVYVDSMLILLGFWMLVNYVYVDSNGYYNACKLCIFCFQ